jgi:hypothetical protein
MRRAEFNHTNLSNIDSSLIFDNCRARKNLIFCDYKTRTATLQLMLEIK